MNLLIKVLKILLREYFRDDKSDQMNPPPSAQTQLDYMTLIRVSLSFFDWLCINNKFLFLFNEESGRANLAFIINTCNMILCQFRKPLEQTFDRKDSTAIPETEDNLVMGMFFTVKPENALSKKSQQPMPTMEDLTFNDRANREV